MLLRAPAKVNLSLAVLGKRADGYHDISSIMRGACLFDDVTLKMEFGGDVISGKAKCDAPTVPTGESNLAVRAIVELLEAIGVNAVFEVELTKRIPVAAGLGGGSADAAAALLAAATELRLEDTGKHRQLILDVAGRIGADVPFCVHTCALANPHVNLFAGDAYGTALAEGIGDILTPIVTPQRAAEMLILELPLEISAREIYSQVREYSSGESSAALVRALAAADSAAVKANMSNDLERVAIFLYPEIGDSIDQLKELYGSDAAVLMSGSGPTVFAYFQEGYGDRPPLQLGESSKAKAHLVSLL